MKPTPPVFYVKTYLHIVTANRDRNCKANWTFICFLPAATQDRERWPVPVEPLWEGRGDLLCRARVRVQPTARGLEICACVESRTRRLVEHQAVQGKPALSGVKQIRFPKQKWGPALLPAPTAPSEGSAGLMS